MSSKSLDWRFYITTEGDFELPRYLYIMLMNLMKSSLDFGTLLSNDSAKLRAFKEQTKNLYKKRWLEVAQALEAFEIIVPCGCPLQEYCSRCSGSRYLLNNALSPDQLREIAVVIGPNHDETLAAKLEVGLQKALREVGVNGTSS